MSSMHAGRKNHWRATLRLWQRIYVCPEPFRQPRSDLWSKKSYLKAKAAAGAKPTTQVQKSGSIWIDPESHKIMQMGSDNTITPSHAIYAVGAMTRGQIIDASMARSIVQSTARIASDIIGYLTRKS